MPSHLISALLISSHVFSFFLISPFRFSADLLSSPQVAFHHRIRFRSSPRTIATPVRQTVSCEQSLDISCIWFLFYFFLFSLEISFSSPLIPCQTSSHLSLFSALPSSSQLSAHLISFSQLFLSFSQLVSALLTSSRLLSGPKSTRKPAPRPDFVANAKTKYNFETSLKGNLKGKWRTPKTRKTHKNQAWQP